jgi:hypothetical protein
MAAASQESGGSASLPDLAIGANSTLNKDYFLVPVNGLKLNTTYQFQFQYEYTDGTLSAWSPAYALPSKTEGVPAAPGVTFTGGPGYIQASLSTFPANASRVDIRIANGIFGNGTKVVDSFVAAGTKTITAPGSATPGLAYVCTALTVTPGKVNGTPDSVATVYVTDPAASIAVEPSVTPSTPTVSQVLGAIQLSWNGKRADGSDQPAGFKAAKVYVGTSAGFTPVDTGTAGANQVDILNFSNGQNTLNVSVGTIVNGVALTYGTDYYVKIKTTNGNVAQDSSAVSATGNPVRIGQVGSGDIVSVTADKIYSGTISSQTITVGAPGGKRVELRGSGNPFEIFGTGGTSLLSYNTGDTKLTITGDGTFTGVITGASGTFAGNLSSSNGAFTVNNGLITATSGTIGGWNLTGSSFESATVSGGKITLNPATPSLILTSSSGNISLDPTDGLKHSSGNFQLQPNGTLTLKGSLYIGASDNILSNGTFSLGSGGLTYNGTDLTLGSNLKFNYMNDSGNVSLVYADDNQYGNRSSVTVNTNGQLVRGRAFYYGSVTIPGSGNTSRSVYNSVNGTYDTVAFVAGDIWMTVD